MIEVVAGKSASNRRANMAYGDCAVSQKGVA